MDGVEGRASWLADPPNTPYVLLFASQALKFVVVDQLYEIDADVAADCVAMAAEEMTQSKVCAPRDPI